MDRTVSADLDAWLKGPRRKPLVLRGARQVGKTWLVRDLGGGADRARRIEVRRRGLDEEPPPVHVRQAPLGGAASGREPTLPNGRGREDHAGRPRPVSPPGVAGVPGVALRGA